MARRPEIRAGVVLLGVVACAGCTHRPNEGDRVTTSAGGDASALAAPSAPNAMTASSPATAPAVAAEAGAAVGPTLDCEEGRPKTGKSIGHTSVVFKLELSSGKKAAWKPNAHKVKGRYKGEIAAFRLARALGITNVPAVCFRSFDVASVTAALAANEPAKKLLDEEVIVEDGSVRGAVIPWIDGLQFWPLEKDPLRSDARQWLTAKAALPPDKVDLARQTSSLIAFDFLTGNWDRYSGENVGLDRSGATVLYIDNDAAFMDGPPKEPLARNKARLQATDRFSRSLVEHIRDLDEAGLTRAFGEETAGVPLLAPPLVQVVARRAKELVALVDEKTKAHGEAETLFFH